jgi:Ala-tRNA(Pro) deacylase
MDIYKILAEHQIEYQRSDHPAVFTVEEAHRLTPDMPGAKTKNLFICDHKGKQHFLIVLEADKRIKLKQLAEVLGVKKVRFASPERLMKHLGITPGAVSILAVINDQEKAVKVVIDSHLWQTAKAILCHPLVNTSTLAIALHDIERLLNSTGQPFQVLELPTEDFIPETSA